MKLHITAVTCKNYWKMVLQGIIHSLNKLYNQHRTPKMFYSYLSNTSAKHKKQLIIDSRKKLLHINFIKNWSGEGKQSTTLYRKITFFFLNEPHNKETWSWEITHNWLHKKPLLMNFIRGWFWDKSIYNKTSCFSCNNLNTTQKKKEKENIIINSAIRYKR